MMLIVNIMFTIKNKKNLKQRYIINFEKHTKDMYM